MLLRKEIEDSLIRQVMQKIRGLLRIVLEERRKKDRIMIMR